MSESGYPGLKDEQDDHRDVITNYQLDNWQLYLILMGKKRKGSYS
jgi:hypothetical protein